MCPFAARASAEPCFVPALLRGPRIGGEAPLLASRDGGRACDVVVVRAAKKSNWRREGGGQGGALWWRAPCRESLGGGRPRGAHGLPGGASSAGGFGELSGQRADRRVGQARAALSWGGGVSPTWPCSGRRDRRGAEARRSVGLGEEGRGREGPSGSRWD